MKVKIVRPHPHIKPHHVKHTAAGITMAAGIAEVFIPYHVGALLFVIGGCLAIYEPYVAHEVKIVALEEEQADV